MGAQIRHTRVRDNKEYLAGRKLTQTEVNDLIEQENTVELLKEGYTLHELDIIYSKRNKTRQERFMELVDRIHRNASYNKEEMLPYFTEFENFIVSNKKNVMNWSIIEDLHYLYQMDFTDRYLNYFINSVKIETKEEKTWFGWKICNYLNFSPNLILSTEDFTKVLNNTTRLDIFEVLMKQKNWTKDFYFICKQLVEQVEYFKQIYLEGIKKQDAAKITKWEMEELLGGKDEN